MKRLIIVTVFFCTLGCKKEKTCYECELLNVSPPYSRTITQCVEDESDLKTDFYDQYGNKLNVVCKKKQ